MPGVRLLPLLERFAAGAAWPWTPRRCSIELSFADAKHQFDTRNRDRRSPEPWAIA